MSLKLILFYILTFIVLYTEPIPIGGVSVGIAWKIVVILIIILPVLYKALRGKRMELFAVLYFLLAFKTFFSYTSLDYLMETIIIAVKITMFPLMYLFFMEVKSETLLFIAKHYALAIILVFLPYHFGILEPFALGYDLDIYGLTGQYGLIGPFLSPHAASISLAFAMVVISSLINSENSKMTNTFYVLILLLGFYQLMLTYVRTGIAVYLASLAFLYLQNLNMKKILLIIMTIFVLVAGSIVLMENSKAVKMRFEDKNRYVKNQDVGLGSGRLDYWKAAVVNWANDEDIVIFIGLGYTYGIDKMEKSVGMRIFAHNDFFQVLQQEGLIGFIIFISSLIALYKYMKRYNSSKYYRNSMAIFIGMITMISFQGSFYFTIVFFLAIYMVLQKQEYLQEDLYEKI